MTTEPRRQAMQKSKKRKVDFDYAGWVERLRGFLESSQSLKGFTAECEFAPPLPEPELNEVRTALALPMPGAVAALLVKGSGRCSFRYGWTAQADDAQRLAAVLDGTTEICGGADLCHIAELAEWIKDCKAWATETWIADEPEDRKLWLGCFPIARIGNGDYLGVRLGRNQDPPVIYLAHDAESREIAPSFTAFLSAWERLCYLGPEIWMLEPFLDPATSHLDANSEPARKLGEAFQSGA